MNEARRGMLQDGERCAEVQSCSYAPHTFVALPAMRGLTESESAVLFKKLATYIGSNLVHLVDTPDDVSCVRCFGAEIRALQATQWQHRAR